MKNRWAGNVRELANVLERAVNLVENGEIRPEHIILDNEQFYTVPPVPVCEPNSLTLKEATARAERDSLQQALKIYGSARKAAKALGVSHTTVLNKMRRLGLTARRRKHQ
ncbi:TyrR/PhhR family helix-turn-helix DNA-binding protein [Desulforamulus hydrothermalis]|nr:TyrR/PhhR family helix-turn-helix DNA-binding protein [Desulforamulus hydrothermalis]